MPVFGHLDTSTFEDFLGCFAATLETLELAGKSMSKTPVLCAKRVPCLELSLL